MDALSESLRLHDEALRIRNSIKSGTPDLSLERLRTRVERWNKTVSDNPPGPLFKGVVSEHNAALAATSTAFILHSVAQRQQALSDNSVSIAEAERAFSDVLSVLRIGAITENKVLVETAFNTLIGSVFDRLVNTTAIVPASGNADNALDAVRAFHLIHRVCAVVSSIPLLQLRQSSARSSSSLSRIADRRTNLEMPGLPESDAVFTSISSHEPGDRIGLLAYVDTATWVDRPEKPYTRLALANGEELRVHFKNTRRIGIVGGHWAWSRCKVEDPDANTHYAVSEFEGPSSHDNEYWESWLQMTAREIYDITPSSVHLFVSNTGQELDLHARLSNEE